MSQCTSAQAVGIDAPFGWPDHTVQVLTAWARCAPWLDLSAATEAYVDSDDALDALLASLVAHAGHIGRTVVPPADDETLRQRISREGWIHLPDKSSTDGVTRGPSLPKFRPVKVNRDPHVIEYFDRHSRVTEALRRSGDHPRPGDAPCHHRSA